MLLEDETLFGTLETNDIYVESLFWQGYVRTALPDAEVSNWAFCPAVRKCTDGCGERGQRLAKTHRACADAVRSHSNVVRESLGPPLRWAPGFPHIPPPGY